MKQVNILMLGGKRWGKTTVLASMYGEINKALSGTSLKLEVEEQTQRELEKARASPLIRAADNECQGMVSLLNLNILHPAPQHGRNLPVSRCGHDLPAGTVRRNSPSARSAAGSEQAAVTPPTIRISL